MALPLRKLGGGIAAAADPDWPKGCPVAYGVYSATESGVQMEKVSDVQSDGIYLSKKLLHVMSPAFLQVAEHLPAHEKYQISCLF